MNDLKAPEKALQTMLIYYYQTIAKTGVDNPKKIMATNLASMINLSKEQSQFIVDNTENDNLNATETIDSLIALLLPYTEKRKTIDKEDAKLMISNLKRLKKNIKL